MQGLMFTLHHLVSRQSRRGVSYMVSVCGQDVHSRQHLLAHAGVGHDAPGQSLRHGAAQHVWPEEHLRPGDVRQRAGDSRWFMVRGVCARRALTSRLCHVSGFRSFPACWWRPRTAFSTSTTWIHRMEASVSLSKNTGAC